MDPLLEQAEPFGQGSTPVQITTEGLWYVGPDGHAWRLDHPDGLSGVRLSETATFTVNDRTRAVVRALLVLALERLDASQP